jgi:uncharacterized membrane protein YeaQ/YmgE (transglycosylase-associated protein family)
MWAIAGLTIGWLASLLMTPDSNQGTLTDVVLGIVGAIVGGALMSILGQPTVSGFSFYNLAVAVLGAVLLTWMGRVLNNPADYR